MFSRSIGKTLKLGAAFMLALGVSAHAQSGTIIDNFGSTDTRMGWYVDFASTSPGHFSEPTTTLAGSVVKYHIFRVITQSTSDAACFDIATAHPDFVPAATADTRIWFANQTTGLDQVLNDDFGGALFSRGRVWLSGSNPFVDMKIAAYNPTWNTAHFKVYVDRLPLSEAACTTTNGGIPWVKNKAGVFTSG
jgi:hypothetical protein